MEAFLGIFVFIFVAFLVFGFVEFFASKYHESGEDVHIDILNEYGKPIKSLYTSKKYFSLHHEITITDENDNVVYKANSEFFSIHDKTYVYDANDHQIAYMYRKLLTLHQRHVIEMKDGTKFELASELFHLIKDITNIEGLGWVIEGNVAALNFFIKDQEGKVIAVIGQKPLSIHDKYSIDIYDISKEDYIITILIALQHMLSYRNAGGASASASSASSN